MKKVVLLSISSEMAEHILSGRKRWEYRRVSPKDRVGSRVILYASGHRKEIVGEFLMTKILREPLDLLIQHTLRETPHREEQIRAYFAGLQIGSALKVENPERYSTPISLKEIREKAANFIPPQNFRYLRADDMKLKAILELLPV